VLIDSAGVAAGSTMSRYMFSLDYLAAEFASSPHPRSYQALLIKIRCLLMLMPIMCIIAPTNAQLNQALIGFTKSGGYTSFKK